MKLFAVLLVLAHAAAFAAEIPEEKIPLLKIGERTYTNATLRILNASNAAVLFSGGGVRVNLADLPEPWRAKYYDEKKITQAREAPRLAAERNRAASEAAAKARAEREQTETDKAKEPWVVNEWIEVSPTKATRDSLGGMTITGTLKSKATKHTLKRLSIRFSIYDDDGHKIGEAADYLATLDPGETWKFEASSFKLGSYKLESVRCSDGRLG